MSCGVKCKKLLIQDGRHFVTKHNSEIPRKTCQGLLSLLSIKLLLDSLLCQNMENGDLEIDMSRDAEYENLPNSRWPPFRNEAQF